MDSDQTMQTHSEMIRAYIRAKDENRPYLMKRTFAESVILEMAVETASITFPPVTQGLGAVTQVLVRDFGRTFENVYTFCLTDPPRNNDSPFTCDWLVSMSEKESGVVRVGCGRYDWFFQTKKPGLVEKLKIVVSIMLVLPPHNLCPVMDWICALPYPWCQREGAANEMPNIGGLKAVSEYITRPRA
jgi:hypothetical protein